MNASSDLAELSSLRAQLQELVERITHIADQYRSSPDSAIVNDLDAAERSLIATRRALERASGALSDLAH